MRWAFKPVPYGYYVAEKIPIIAARRQNEKLSVFQIGILTEYTHQTHQHNTFMEEQQSRFVGRGKLLKECVEAIKATESGLVMVHGIQGSGKTAFMVSGTAMEIVSELFPIQSYWS